jgi:hypothetical protein
MLLSVENIIYAEQVGVEVMLYICIWHIVGLKFTWNISYPEVFHGFPWFLWANVRIVPQSGHDCFLPNHF